MSKDHSINTSFSFDIHISKWRHNAEGLVKWKDSKYYKSNIDTDFHLNYATVLSPSISVEINKILIGYIYSFQGIDGNFSSFSGLYKYNNGKVINSITGNISGHQIFLTYKLSNTIFPFFEIGISNESIGITDPYTISESNSLEIITLNSDYKWINFGIVLDQKLRNNKNKIYSRIGLAPVSRLNYEYFKSSNSLSYDRIDRYIFGFGLNMEIGLICEVIRSVNIMPFIRYDSFFGYTDKINDYKYGIGFKFRYNF